MKWYLLRHFLPKCYTPHHMWNQCHIICEINVSFGNLPQKNIRIYLDFITVYCNLIMHWTIDTMFLLKQRKPSQYILLRKLHSSVYIFRDIDIVYFKDIIMVVSYFCLCCFTIFYILMTEILRNIDVIKMHFPYFHCKETFSVFSLVSC
jgi:hypothetical protein